MSKEMTAEIWICDSCNKEYGFTNEVTTPTRCTCGSTTFVPHTVAKEAVKSIEEKQKHQDEQYAIIAREYELALNEVIRLQNIVDAGNKEAVKEFAEELMRRRNLIMSEPDGIVRETMIANLLVDLFLDHQKKQQEGKGE